MARNDRIQNLEQALTNADQRNAQKDKKYEATVQLLQNRLMESELYLCISALTTCDRHVGN